MKKVIVFLSFLLPLSALSQTANISGSLKNIKDTVNKIFVYYFAQDKRITDSTNVTGNKYSFKIKTTEPVLVQMVAQNTENKKSRVSRKDVATVYLEPGNIQITSTDSFSNVKVVGSKANMEYDKLTARMKPYNKLMDSLYVKYTEFKKAKNMTEVERIDKVLDSIDDKGREAVYVPYVKKNPTSPIAVYALSQYAGYSIDAMKVEPLFNLLSVKNKNSESGKVLKNKIELAKSLDVGKTAIDFTQNDTLDKPVKLSSFKGKYVLLDFWASWCGPCRAENPNVVKVFNEYKDKGFTVLGVSLDRPGDKDKWLKAIHDDGLTWTHVSDLQFWNNAVAKTYGIQAIPSNFLLDKDGKIIGKNLRGEDLEKKLKEVL